MDVVWTYLSPGRISRPAALTGNAARPLKQTSVPRLVRVYSFWKTLVFLVAVASPGYGYDTSTHLFIHREPGEIPRQSWLAHIIHHVVLRLTRWDAIYFVSASAHGKVYEQEWAFSWVLSNMTSFTSRVLLWLVPVSPVVKNAIAGALISHVTHLLAVLILYQLVYTMTPSVSEYRKRQLAFTTACLHILSPAGIFLSTPYAEAPFALCNFLGHYCYAIAVDARFANYADAYQIDALWTVLAGFSFGLASTMRANGLLSAVVFAWDALDTLPRLPHLLRTHEREELTRLCATLLAGVITGVAYAAPQVVAYLEYCTHGRARPWCSALPPSIYTFVQSHYWDVGFLRYWKLSNLPLFLIAAPVGLLMLETALPAILNPRDLTAALGDPEPKPQTQLQPPPPSSGTLTPRERQAKVLAHLLPRFALPQVLLVGLAVTSFHVQILNRISSGYPLWYCLLAFYLQSATAAKSKARDAKAEERVPEKREGRQGKVSLFGKEGFRAGRGNGKALEWIVRGMVIYAIVQAGLYAAFLPPA